MEVNGGVYKGIRFLLLFYKIIKIQEVGKMIKKKVKETRYGAMENIKAIPIMVIKSKK